MYNITILPEDYCYMIVHMIVLVCSEELCITCIYHAHSEDLLLHNESFSKTVKKSVLQRKTTHLRHIMQQVNNMTS